MKQIYMTAANRWKKKRSFGMGKKYMISNIFLIHFFSLKNKILIDSVTDVKNGCIYSSVQMLGMCYLVQRVARWRQLMLEVIHNTCLVGLTQTVKRCNKNWESALGIKKNQKVNAEHISIYKCLLVVAFPCIWGFWGKIFVESTPTCTFV